MDGTEPQLFGGNSPDLRATWSCRVDGTEPQLFGGNSPDLRGTWSCRVDGMEPQLVGGNSPDLRATWSCRVDGMEPQLVGGNSPDLRAIWSCRVDGMEPQLVGGNGEGMGIRRPKPLVWLPPPPVSRELSSCRVRSRWRLPREVERGYSPSDKCRCVLYLVDCRGYCGVLCWTQTG